MLRRLPATRTCGFLLLLRLLQPRGGMGVLGPGVTPANWPLVGAEGAGRLLGSLGGGSRVVRPGLACRLPSALDGSPRSCAWINGQIWGHSN